MDKRAQGFITLLIITLSVYGQQIPQGYADAPKFYDGVELGRNILITYNMSPTYDTEGTPYLFEEFQNGELFFRDMTKMSGLKLNYNCTTGDILFQYGGDAYITTRDDIDYFVIYPSGQDTVLLFYKQLLPDRRKAEFLEIMYNDHSLLMKRHFKDFKEASVKTPYHANREFNEYVDKEEYYLKFSNNEIYNIKPNKKAILSILPEKSELISDFIKNENIRLKHDTDLIRVIKYYDSL
jgi:hypothetical protein